MKTNFNLYWVCDDTTGTKRAVCAVDESDALSLIDAHGTHSVSVTWLGAATWYIPRGIVSEVPRYRTRATEDLTVSDVQFIIS